jgi:hypothetical protein
MSDFEQAGLPGLFSFQEAACVVAVTAGAR